MKLSYDFYYLKVQNLLLSLTLTEFILKPDSFQTVIFSPPNFKI